MFSDNTKNSSSSMKLDVRLKNKIWHCFKGRHRENLCCERTSQFYVCVYIQCRRRPTDCILSFLFLAETDVLVPVFSQATDVVVVNFVVVQKLPIVTKALFTFHFRTSYFRKRGHTHMQLGR